MTIRYLLRPHEPVDVRKVSTAVDGGRDLASLLIARDQAILDKEWASLVTDHPKAFSAPRALASLYDTSRGALMFLPTDFKTYVGIARSHERKVKGDTEHWGILSDPAYQQMRVGAVGAAVRFKDGVYAVHRRPANATHVPNMIDSSVAGLAFVNDACTGFKPLEDMLYSKLGRELNLAKEHVSTPRLTGVHNSPEHDYSGMFSFQMDADLPSSELERLANPAWMTDCYRVHEKELPDFIIEHYGITKDMSGDGAAVMLSALAPQLFLDTVKTIQGKGQEIAYGKLVDGRFEQWSIPWDVNGKFAPPLSSRETL